MLDLVSHYWPHILFVLSIVLGAIAAIHATMTKEEVRTAIGWVGVIVLSPIVGAVVYAIAGVNRIRRSTLSYQRANLSNIALYHLSHFDTTNDRVRAAFGRQFGAMKILGDAVSLYDFTSGNTIEMLETGDEAYAAMLGAIGRAERSIVLETYIFDHDAIGKKFADALGDAVQRGVEVRVLVDAVGARYSFPSIVKLLKEKGVKVAVFNGNIIIGLRLPYANLRTHRKMLIVDGQTAFTGGMNIRAGFVRAIAGDAVAFDTHFKLEGPAIADLFHIASEDWRFATGELLTGEAWSIAPPENPPGTGTLVRVVGSGPDKNLETNHRMMMGAFSIARQHILIITPYLLPDRELISALVTAARRGVSVDIVVPGVNNLKLVDRAMRAQFDQLLRDGCRIWRAGGAFNHSKLMTIDGAWSYVGSSNIDPRSLRLNFEVDLEILDRDVARQVEERIGRVIEQSREVNLVRLKNRPFLERLLDRIIWLGSPFL
ncbi:cardiolipin synthase [Brucella sp. BO3]|uniref:cardiolipin synthase n=1 Tax=unclassified Brucella TaxID=2632610 RepID=UPI0001E443D6|nr:MULTISPECIES: cardiolipin synthase [unclassified Brucella]EFM58970.1 cardiolipin synthase [Brucella sp. BO2]OEI82790.1 cardiolipin synthase [Brucella sp. B13-0095]QGA57902.1 cardiolipin synthase [Brucella sp. 2280]QMV27727.1 cardiolipin synthase [Brucella sp. BO3]QPN27659.1 cardiolipin synthase [Brucella sp. BO2]